MASERASAKNFMDERLVIALNNALETGENVLIQIMADQGQALAITDNRILVIRAGLKTTGALNGQKVVSFKRSDIKSIKIRRGPLGALAQIISSGSDSVSVGEPPPDNVIIFNGEIRAKKCESFGQELQKLGINVEYIGMNPKSISSPEKNEMIHVVEGEPKEETVEKENTVAQEIHIEQVTNDTVEAVEETLPPVIDKPQRIKKEFKSLADEMFEDMASEKPFIPEEVIIPEVADISNSEQIESIVEEHEAEEVFTSIINEIEDIASAIPQERKMEDVEAYKPNPRLPKPASKTAKKLGKSMAVLIVLGLMAFAGMAIIKSAPKIKNIKQIDVSKIAQNATQMQEQLDGILEYKKQVQLIISKTAQARASVNTNNESAMIKSEDVLHDAITQIEDMQTPLGLVDVREQLKSAFFEYKSLAVQLSNGEMDEDTLGKSTNMSQQKIKLALSIIEKNILELQSKIRAVSKSKLQENK